MDTQRVIRTGKRYGCPVEVTLEVISGKWKCVILWWLRSGTKRFGELMQLIPGMTQKVLTTQLRELEADNLIRRQAFREKPPRVEYSLTADGETLRPLVDLMCEWGKSKLPQFQFGLLRLEGLHITLVSTSDPIQRQLFQELVEMRGAQMTTVAPASRLETLTQPQLDIIPDIIIVELNSSTLNLGDLLPQTQQIEANQPQPIPAIALVTQAGDRSLAFAQGFRIVLTTPLEPVELVVAIASLTKRMKFEE